MSNLKPVVIFDLDGTLANLNHRLHHVKVPACPACCDSSVAIYSYIQHCESCMGTGENKSFKKNWDAFYDECDKDTPIVATIRILLQLWSSGSQIWIWTGRGEVAKAKTEKWLADHVFSDIELPSNVHLRMRKTDDKRPTWKVKQEWLNDLPKEHKERIVCVFEDSPSVCDMWQDEDVQVYQVREPKF